MMNFLTAKKGAPKAAPGTSGEMRYSRFVTKEGERPLRHGEYSQRPVIPKAPTTRMVHKHVKPEPEPIAAPAVKTATPVDENAHLYASSAIPVSVLEKALPMRFAKMRDSDPTSAVR